MSPFAELVFFSQTLSGLKNSRIGLADISRVPVSCSRASCHGLLLPSLNSLASSAPAVLELEKSHLQLKLFFEHWYYKLHTFWTLILLVAYILSIGTTNGLLSIGIKSCFLSIGITCCLLIIGITSCLKGIGIKFVFTTFVIFGK